MGHRQEASSNQILHLFSRLKSNQGKSRYPFFCNLTTVTRTNDNDINVSKKVHK